MVPHFHHPPAQADAELIPCVGEDWHHIDRHIHVIIYRKSLPRPFGLLLHQFPRVSRDDGRQLFQQGLLLFFRRLLAQTGNLSDHISELVESFLKQAIVGFSPKSFDLCQHLIKKPDQILSDLLHSCPPSICSAVFYSSQLWYTFWTSSSSSSISRVFWILAMSFSSVSST